MTSPMPARRRPPGRYDERSMVAPRLLAVLLAALFLGLVAAIALTLFDRYGNPQVRGRTVGFDVLSERAVRVDLEVTKSAGARAYCFVRARDRSGAEVGREAVAVDARGSDRTTVRLSHVLPTTGEAVTGEVGRCSAEPIPTAPAAP